MHRLFTLTTALAAALLAACTPQLRTNIAVFHSLPEQSGPASYAFMPLRDQDAAFENAAYRKSIKAELLRHGYRETTFDEASVVVAFSHSIDHDRGADPAAGRDTDEYSRRLWLYLMDKRSLDGEAMHVLYEGDVVTFGPASQLGNAVPFMIKALLQDFPGKSGTLRTEHLTVD